MKLFKKCYRTTMLLSFPPPLGFLLCALQKAVLKALFFINYEFRDQIFNKHITQEFVGHRPS